MRIKLYQKSKIYLICDIEGDEDVDGGEGDDGDEGDDCEEIEID